MDRIIIPWVIVFGLVMIALNQYKYYLQDMEIKNRGLDNPLVYAIQEHVKKEEEGSGSFIGMVREGKEVGRAAPDFSLGKNVEGGAQVPVDGFIDPVEGDSDGGSISQMLRLTRSGGSTVFDQPVVQGRSRLLDIKDREPEQQSFYPPTVQTAPEAQTPASDIPQAYYPPVVP